MMLRIELGLITFALAQQIRVLYVQVDLKPVYWLLRHELGND